VCCAIIRIGCGYQSVRMPIRLAYRYNSSLQMTAAAWHACVRSVPVTQHLIQEGTTQYPRQHSVSLLPAGTYRYAPTAVLRSLARGVRSSASVESGPAREYNVRSSSDKRESHIFLKDLKRTTMIPVHCA
jgi:hypothetical protein